MTNRIRTTSIRVHRLTPAEAEVWITAEVESAAPTAELRGKLVGPRCPGVTTVEVAYPLRPLPRAPTPGPNTRTVRAVIPEPNIWSREAPFVYEGKVELWQDGHRCDEVAVSVGFKLGADAGQ